MKKIVNQEQLIKIAEKMALKCQPNDVIALIGDLGTGKTTFSKAFGKILGVKENIKSPTFTYVSEYKSGKMPLFHFDVYRLEEAEEIYDIGYEDYIHSGGVSLIEWADIIESELPDSFLKINLRYLVEENKREIEIKWINNKVREKEIEEYADIGDWYFFKNK